MIDFIEEHGLDLTPQERTEIRSAIADSAADNEEAFVSFEEIERKHACAP